MQAAVKGLFLGLLLHSHSKQLVKDFCFAGCEWDLCALREKFLSDNPFDCLWSSASVNILWLLREENQGRKDSSKLCS